MITRFILVSTKGKKSQDLIDQIDQKIANISNMLLEKIRLGLTIDINYNLYEDLIFYRSILEDKLCNDTCLCDYSLNQITSKIKRLLNQTC